MGSGETGCKYMTFSEFKEIILKFLKFAAG